MMDIKKAKRKDIPELLALQRLAYQAEALLYNDQLIQPLTENEASVSKAMEQGLVLKALNSKKIIGSVRATLEQGTCLIGKLIVAPELQSQGIGQKLMAAIETAFRKAERFELSTGHQSVRNLTFYHQLGYREFKRKRVNDNLILVYLEKNNNKA